MRRSRTALLVAVLFTVTAACGGSDDGGSGNGEATADSPVVVADEATPSEVGDVVVTSMGPDEGFAAVIYALDAGYSAEQISTAAFAGTLGDAGQIDGVQPEGPPNGFITAPGEPAGFARHEVGPGVARSADATTVSPEDVYRQIDRKMTTVATIRLLGAGLGVDADITYEDVFPSASTAGEADPAASVEGAKAMIGVLLALMDVGYTFDQALNGYIFGEWDMAIGLDMTDASSTGVTLGEHPVNVCLALRDDDGALIQPGGSAGNHFFGSATCANAIRGSTIFFDGVEEALSAANAPEDDKSSNEAPEDAGEGAFRMEGAIALSDEGGSLSVAWSGSFDVIDGVIAGAGSGTATAEGECRVGDGEGHFYSFSASWQFQITGSATEETLDFAFDPEAGTADISTGAGTESGELCVDVARDVMVAFAEPPPEAGFWEITVPATGGTATIGEEPILIDIHVTQA